MEREERGVGINRKGRGEEEERGTGKEGRGEREKRRGWRERDLNFPSGRGTAARQGLAEGRDWRAPLAAARGSSHGPSSPGGVARGGGGSWKGRRDRLAESARSPAVWLRRLRGSQVGADHGQ